MSDPSRSSRLGHLYIGAKRGRWETDWKQATFYTHVYFRYAPCLTDFTFEFIWRPISPILSPSSRTFVNPCQRASAIVFCGIRPSRLSSEARFELRSSSRLWDHFCMSQQCTNEKNRSNKHWISSKSGLRGEILSNPTQRDPTQKASTG
jgi:hypothetical protein